MIWLEKMWQNSKFLGSYNNRFETMGNMAANMASGIDGDGDDDFQTVRSKRRKRNESTDESDTLNRELFLNSSNDNKLNMIFGELQQMRISQDTANRGMSNFQNSFVAMNEKLGQVIDVTNSHTSVLKTIAYKSIDLEARSRRNNLIFWGFHETPNENCFGIIRDFIADRDLLNLDPSTMYLTRAHRLGPRRIGIRNPRRPIIVNFRDFCDTQSIMERAYVLRNTSFSVGYDLPKEINDARKKLWDELKSIKSRQPRVKAQIVYPTKLIVDGKVVMDEFPDWNVAMRSSRLVDFSHVDRISSYNQPIINFAESRHNNSEPLLSTNSVNENPTTRSTTRSTTPVTQVTMNGQNASRDIDMDQTESGVNITSAQPNPRPVSMETAEINSEPQRITTMVSKAHSRSLSQPASLFRPFDQNMSAHGPNPSESTTQNANIDLPPNSIRISRPLERGMRREPSGSGTRKSKRSESTSSKNKQSCAQNNSQSKQKSGQSSSRTPTPVAANNSNTGASGGASNQNTDSAD